MSVEIRIQCACCGPLDELTLPFFASIKSVALGAVCTAIPPSHAKLRDFLGSRRDGWNSYADTFCRELAAHGYNKCLADCPGLLTVQFVGAGFSDRSKKRSGEAQTEERGEAQTESMEEARESAAEAFPVSRSERSPTLDRALGGVGAAFTSGPTLWENVKPSSKVTEGGHTGSGGNTGSGVTVASGESNGGSAAHSGAGSVGQTPRDADICSESQSTLRAQQKRVAGARMATAWIAAWLRVGAEEESSRTNRMPQQGQALRTSASLGFGSVPAETSGTPSSSSSTSRGAEVRHFPTSSTAVTVALSGRTPTAILEGALQTATNSKPNDRVYSNPAHTLLNRAVSGRYVRAKPWSSGFMGALGLPLKLAPLPQVNIWGEGISRAVRDQSK